MKVRTTTITPALAQKWLNESERENRNLAKGRVDRFVHAINEGQWQLTHQPIALDVDKNVIDGQHRLQAIAIAGKDVVALVAYDCDPSTFDVIDTGAARTAADTLKIAGYTNANVLGASARQLMAYDLVVGRPDLSFRKTMTTLTTRDVVDLLGSERGDTLRRSITTAYAAARTLSRFGMTTWMTTAHAIIMENGERPDAAALFFDRLTDGVMLQEGSPILALRRWIQGGTGLVNAPAAYRGQFGISNTIKAYNMYLAKRDVSFMHSKRTDALPRVIVPEVIEEKSA